MLTITEAAGTYLTQILHNAEPPQNATIRMVPVQTGNLALQFDSTRPGDTTFDHNGKTVLILDEQVAQTLVNSTLDVQQADQGAKLVLRH
jgi:Fe-S cluster assembly iron-binding protein IscA